MKTLKNILGVAAIAVTFTSCLKDKKITDQEYGMYNYDKQKIVELPSPPNHVNTIALDFKNEVVTIDLVTAAVAADLPVSEDVTVTLSLANSNTMIADYNAANSTNYVAFPANFYSLQGSGLTVTIPKGSRMAAVKATTNSINFNPSTTYALGFTITAVDKQGYDISTNFGKVLVTIGAKNKYDGVYTLRFKMLDWLAAHGIDNAVVDWGGPVHMETVAGDAVKLFDDWGFGTYIHPAATPTAYTGFGSTQPRFIFDLATNKLVNCVNDFIGARTFSVNPAVTDSRWQPLPGGGGDIYAAIIMKQAGRTDLRIFDTLRYVGPR
jgi:hypothetical protein